MKYVNDTLTALQNGKSYVSKPYDGKFDMDKQEKHYTNEIEKYFELKPNIWGLKS